jgi:hypothetical protein
MSVKEKKKTKVSKEKWTNSGYQNEIICTHGVGHGHHIHGCCGCCTLQSYKEARKKLKGEK